MLSRVQLDSNFEDYLLQVYICLWIVRLLIILHIIVNSVSFIFRDGVSEGMFEMVLLKGMNVIKKMKVLVKT